MTQFWVLLKSKQLYVSFLIIILVAVLVGIPESSQPTWKGNIKPSEKSKTYQPSASKVNSDPTIYKYNLFSSVELPVEKTFHKIKAFNGNGVKDVLHLKRSNRKKRTSIMRLSDQPKIRAPIPVIKSRIEIKKVTKGLGEKLPLLMDIDRGRYDKKEISLTFDGGSGKKHAREILRTLKEKGIVTTIFLSGDFIIKYPDIVLEMAEDGHEIGNHTYSHPHLTSYEDTWRHQTLPGVDKGYLREELSRTSEAYKNVTGRDMAPVWRAPYGEVNKEIIQWGYEAGFTHVDWTRGGKRKESLDTLDWVSDRGSKYYHTAEEIKEKVLNFGKGKNGLNGGIVLMHLSTERNTELAHLRLGEIIDTLRNEGYRFVTVSKLIKDLKTGEHIQVASKHAVVFP